MGNKIKFLSTREKKRTAQHPCYNIQPWLTSWNISCCRVVLVWQTIDDHLWYWQCWILAMDIEELYFKWTYTYISVDDIGQIFRKRLLFLKPDITITVPEGRCCCSVSDIKYYCWVAEVIYSSWVPDIRDCW